MATNIWVATNYMFFFDIIFLTSKWSYESYSNVFRILLFTHVVTSFFGDKNFLWLGYFENWDASLYWKEICLVELWSTKKNIACTSNHHLTLRFNWSKLGQPKKRMSHQILNFHELSWSEILWLSNISKQLELLKTVPKTQLEVFCLRRSKKSEMT